MIAVWGPDVKPGWAIRHRTAIFVATGCLAA
jgi:hypothetical protein